MEHDEKCERVGVARAIAGKVDMSRAEYEHMTSAEMPMGIVCGCRDRRIYKFPKVVEKAVYRTQGMMFLVAQRKLEKESFTGPDGFNGGEAWLEMHMRRAAARSDGRVIPVDFRNRRRID